MYTPSTTITSTSKLDTLSNQERVEKLDKQVDHLEKETSDWQIIILAKKIFRAIHLSYCTVKDQIYKVYDFVYAKNRVTGVREVWIIPTWLEKRIGENTFPNEIYINGGESIRPEITKLISNIKNRLIPVASKDCPDFDFEIKAVSNKDKLFSKYTLGGKVLISELLIDQIAHEKDDFGFAHLNLTLEDKIAAVISRRLINTCAGHLKPNYLDNILDADHYSIHYLNKAEYNPAAGL